jgi:hypothetical protein
LGVCQKYYLANQLKGYEKVWKDPPGFNDACRDPVAEEDWGTELWDDWPFSINVSSNANEDINWETSISSKSTSMLWLLGLENIWAVERDDVDRRNWTNADPFPPATTAAAGSRWQGWWDMQHKIYVHCPFHFVFAINQNLAPSGVKNEPADKIFWDSEWKCTCAMHRTCIIHLNSCIWNNFQIIGIT